MRHGPGVQLEAERSKKELARVKEQLAKKCAKVRAPPPLSVPHQTRRRHRPPALASRCCCQVAPAPLHASAAHLHGA